MRGDRPEQHNHAAANRILRRRGALCTQERIKHGQQLGNIRAALLHHDALPRSDHGLARLCTAVPERRRDEELDNAQRLRLFKIRRKRCKPLRQARAAWPRVHKRLRDNVPDLVTHGLRHNEQLHVRLEQPVKHAGHLICVLRQSGLECVAGSHTHGLVLGREKVLKHGARSAWQLKLALLPQLCGWAGDLLVHIVAGNPNRDDSAVGHLKGEHRQGLHDGGAEQHVLAGVTVEQNVRLCSLDLHPLRHTLHLLDKLCHHEPGLVGDARVVPHHVHEHRQHFRSRQKCRGAEVGVFAKKHHGVLPC